MEQQTPRTHPAFWRSSAGVATALVGGLAVVGGAVALYAKPAAATPSGPAGVISVVPGHYYLFQVKAAADPTALLQGVGFAQVQAQPDPINAGNWIVTAFWTGTANGVATGFLPDIATWSVNGALTDNGTIAPPTPIAWAADNGSGTGTENLKVGDWYSFALRTSFLSGTPNAAATVASMLVTYGWGGAMVTAAADASSSPDTWNVYAQWDGASSEAADGPPLWILLPQKVIPGTATPAQGPIDLGATQPTAAPPNTMPW